MLFAYLVNEQKFTYCGLIFRSESVTEKSETLSLWVLPEQTHKIEQFLGGGNTDEEKLSIF